MTFNATRAQMAYIESISLLRQEGALVPIFGRYQWTYIPVHVFLIVDIFGLNSHQGFNLEIDRLICDLHLFLASHIACLSASLFGTFNHHLQVCRVLNKERADWDQCPGHSIHLANLVQLFYGLVRPATDQKPSRRLWTDKSCDKGHIGENTEE